MERTHRRMLSGASLNSNNNSTFADAGSQDEEGGERESKFFPFCFFLVSWRFSFPSSVPSGVFLPLFFPVAFRCSCARCFGAVVLVSRMSLAETCLEGTEGNVQEDNSWYLVWISGPPTALLAYPT